MPSQSFFIGAMQHSFTWLKDTVSA